MIYTGKFSFYCKYEYKSTEYFSESELRCRPYVTDFESGASAAILGVYYGWLDGINDLKNTPRIAYERHGPLGGVAGTLIALANGLLKPLVGTLSSVTWLCRGLYASVNNPMLNDKDDEANTVNTLGLSSSSSSSSDMILDNEQQQYNDSISEVAIEAAMATGFKPEQCKRILFEFNKIKKQRSDIHSHEHQS